MTFTLDWTRRHDLLLRRDLARANAVGARVMAARFDAEADRLNAELRGDAGFDDRAASEVTA